jgi:D-lactate dehydrogenase
MRYCNIWGGLKDLSFIPTNHLQQYSKLYFYGVRYISLRSVGHDYIDLKSARSLGIKVANVPTYSPWYSVAEHAVALLLALNRKNSIRPKANEYGDYVWTIWLVLTCMEKKVRIIGTGKIRCFCKNHAWFWLFNFDPTTLRKWKLKKTNTYNIHYLRRSLQNSDVISVHCPLNSETKYMFHRSVSP